MTVWVALLRAVNVSGVNPLPMAGFRTMLADLGLSAAKTYIQTGNAVFRSDLAGPALSAGIADGVLARFGFRPPVFVIDRGAFQATLDANPFPQVEEPTHLHALFMERALPDAGFAFLNALAAEGEAFALRGRVLWLHLPQGFGRSPLAKRVMALPVDITARNLRSVRAIADLAQSLGPG
ncbi:MAG: DUF1697 domain-containing protein [Rhodobacteraceae bacterium]|nr:DUF1697 domain-containing protein [Paracoccaceae bacterium]